MLSAVLKLCKNVKIIFIQSNEDKRYGMFDDDKLLLGKRATSSKERRQ